MVELYDADGNVIGYYDPASGYAEPTETYDAQAVADQAAALWAAQGGNAPAGDSLVQVDELGNPITDAAGNPIRYPVAASGVPDATSEFFPGGGMVPLPTGIFKDVAGALWQYIRTPTGGYKAVAYKPGGAMSPILLIGLAAAALFLTSPKKRGHA